MDWFYSKPLHTGGTVVRLNRYYNVTGGLLTLLGLIAMVYGLWDSWLLIASGGLLILVGLFFVVNYLSFEVCYDEYGFQVRTLHKQKITYSYSDICAQQLYNNAGNILIELHLKDGNAVQLHSNMTGVYTFLDKAFEKWLEQTGCKRENCCFYDPANSCWFPPVEG